MNSLDLDIVELAFIAGLSSFKSLNNKARKQHWPYKKKQKAAGGPVHLYPLSSLPDELQIAWALWDQNRSTQTQDKEQAKGDPGNPDRVPAAVNLNLATLALQLPTRLTYYQPPAYIPRRNSHNRRIYDGASQGLCPAASKILLNRFPDLKSSQKGSTVILISAPQRKGDEETQHPRYIKVPLHQLTAEHTIISEQVVDNLAFKEDWIRHQFNTQPHAIALIQIIGDSMEPTLRNKDLLLIDMNQRRPIDGRMYIIQVGTDLLVKRIEKLVNGTYHLCCDNPKYSKQLFDPSTDEAPPVILGQAIWFGRSL